MRRLPGAIAAVLLVLAGCGVQSANQPQPSGDFVGSSPETASRASGANSSASQAPDATAVTPAEVPEEQQFSLDDVAEFDDGLLIEIAGTVADKASKTDRGAEATNGEIVIASIRIENKTKEPYDAESVLIGAKYGKGKDAQIIIDKTDELQSGFTGTIKPKGEGDRHSRLRSPVVRAEEGDLHRRPERRRTRGDQLHRAGAPRVRWHDGYRPTARGPPGERRPQPRRDHSLQAWPRCWIRAHSRSWY